MSQTAALTIFDGGGARVSSVAAGKLARHIRHSSAETFPAALLEVFVHSNLGRAPRTHSCIEITIPGTVHIESFSDNDLPGWDADNLSVSRAAVHVVADSV